MAILRPWRISDIPDVARCAANPKIAANLRDCFPYPYTEADARDYVTSCIQAGESRQLCRAIEVVGRAAGSIGVFLHDDVYRKSAELGYWLAEDFWGRGIMTDAVRRLCDEAFQRFGIVRIYAEPYAYNLGSRRVLEHAGFQLEGVLRKSVFKNGQLYDSCIYARLLDQ